MSRSLRRALTFAVGSLTALATGPAVAQASTDTKFGAINHIVVIYEENHSFDNLYGGWEGVNGLTGGPVQVDQNGNAYGCLTQQDVNLTSPPLSVTCTDAAHGINSHFVNAPFSIEQFIPAAARTCPQPGVFAPNGLMRGLPSLPGAGRGAFVNAFNSESNS